MKTKLKRKAFKREMRKKKDLTLKLKTFYIRRKHFNSKKNLNLKKKS